MDLLSLFPYQQMQGFSERLLMPIPFMALHSIMDTPAIHDSKSDATLAIGQFMLIKRKAYRISGSHKAVRNEIPDDIALAKRVKEYGFLINLMGGHRLIQTRMYSSSKDLWNGLTRMSVELVGSWFAGLAVFSCILGGFMPLLLPAMLLSIALTANLSQLQWLAPLLALVGTTLWLAAHALIFKMYRIPFYYLRLLPVSY